MFDRPTTESLLRRIFNIFGAGFMPFVSLALIVQSPILIFSLLGPAKAATTTQAFILASAGASLITSCLTMVASAALVYGVFQGLRGESMSLEKCFHIALSHWLPILGLSILTGLAIGLSTLLLIIPGIIVACGLYVAAPVLMVEKRGVADCMDRSWDLTHGYKFNIFFVALCLLVIQGAIGFALGLAVVKVPIPFVATVIDFLVTGFGTALSAVASAVVYHDLRGFREGLGEDELAAVFD